LRLLPFPHHRTCGSAYGGSAGSAISRQLISESRASRNRHWAARWRMPDCSPASTDHEPSRRLRGQIFAPTPFPQFSKTYRPSLPLLPDRRPQPASGPLFKSFQHRGCLTPPEKYPSQPLRYWANSSAKPPKWRELSSHANSCRGRRANSPDVRCWEIGNGKRPRGSYDAWTVSLRRPRHRSDHRRHKELRRPEPLMSTLI
jgi:hypothetical protein